MKMTGSIAAKCVTMIAFVACFATVPSTAQSTDPKADSVVSECSGGVWTPAPVQHAESGSATDPAFHTIYGLSCGGNVLMIRLSNKIGGKNIVVDVLRKVPIGCSGGVWTPTPVQHAESGSATDPAFHTVWGLACGGNVFMVRFSNKISGNNINVDILGQTPAK